MILAVAAAAAQSLRFALQKVLASATLGPAAATWSRFFWSAPIAILGMAVYLGATGQAFPRLGPSFWAYGVAGGVFQILATICTVALFKRRAFAVGITFKKTEVMLTAMAGLVILGDVISSFGAMAIALGFAGVLLLSDPPEGGGVFNRGAALGLLSGFFFALSAVTYRGATLSISDADIVATAGITLAIVTTLQSLLLATWLYFREPGQITETIMNWRTSSLVGLFSMLGSFAWFAAFSIQNAAYVFAVGQVEPIFSLIIGRLAFLETPSPRELWGMLLLTISILAIVIAG